MNEKELTDVKEEWFEKLIGQLFYHSIWEAVIHLCMFGILFISFLLMPKNSFAFFITFGVVLFLLIRFVGIMLYHMCI